jgi:hypothetical protein
MKSPARYAVAADHIFDGRLKHKNAAVLIEGSKIVSLVSQSERRQTETMLQDPG